MIGRIRVIADEKLDLRGHAAVDLAVTTSEGRTHLRQLDIPPGFPGAELDDAQHLARFRDCLAYAPRPPSTAQTEQFLQSLEGIATLPDVRALVPMLIVRQGVRFVLIVRRPGRETAPTAHLAAPAATRFARSPPAEAPPSGRASHQASCRTFPPQRTSAAPAAQRA